MLCVPTLCKAPGKASHLAHLNYGKTFVITLRPFVSRRLCSCQHQRKLSFFLPQRKYDVLNCPLFRDLHFFLLPILFRLPPPFPPPAFLSSLLSTTKKKYILDYFYNDLFPLLFVLTLLHFSSPVLPFILQHIYKKLLCLLLSDHHFFFLLSVFLLFSSHAFLLQVFNLLSFSSFSSCSFFLFQVSPPCFLYSS